MLTRMIVDKVIEQAGLVDVLHVLVGGENPAILERVQKITKKVSGEIGCPIGFNHAELKDKDGRYIDIP